MLFSITLKIKYTPILDFLEDNNNLKVIFYTIFSFFFEQS